MKSRRSPALSADSLNTPSGFKPGFKQVKDKTTKDIHIRQNLFLTYILG